MVYAFENEITSAQEDGLSFEGKQLTWNTAEDVKDVVQSLESQKIVHYLKLSGNTMGVDAAAAIGKALEEHPEFRKALWKDMFTRRLKTEIPLALKYLGQGLITAMAQLTVLDLSDNALGPNGMVGLEDFLRSPVCYTLQELHVNNCGLGIYGARMLSKAVRDCLDNSIKAGTPLTLKVLVAGRNRLENEGAKAIGQMLSELQTLEVIAMPQNSIYYAGIESLAEGIGCNPNLRVLNLNDNTVTSKGAPYLANAISNTPLLQELNLGDCLLKTIGAMCISEVLEDNHVILEVVNMSFNEMNSSAGLIFAAAMKNKPKLKKLLLDGNKFGPDGMDAIIEEMQGAINPQALEDMPDNESECESDEEDDVYSDEDAEEDTPDDDEDAYADHEDIDEYGAEETVYTTSKDFSAGWISGNNKSVLITEFDKAPAAVTPTTENTAVTPTKADIAAEGFFNRPVLTTTFGKSPTTAITAVTPTKAHIAAEAFCLSQKPCTKEMFRALDEDKFDTIMNIIDQFEDDHHILLLVFAALKCAHLYAELPEALDVAVSLYTRVVDYAVITNQERRITNYLLMQLGLLNSEERIKTEYNRKSCCEALRKTVEKGSLSSDYMSNTFKVFLDNMSN